MLPVVNVLFLGLMFLGSGLIINIFQLLALIFVLPFSRSAYRQIIAVLVDLYWSQLVWLVDWWGNVEIRVYSDADTWAHMGKEHALLICNHRSDIDWVVGWVLAQRAGCLGGTRALMKASIKYLPAIGWSLWFAEYIFLARNWSKDEQVIKRGFESLRGFPRPMWMALFVEGTRFTPAKLQAAQEYAVSAGLPVPNHTLVPRTKGFVTAVQSLRPFVPAIYDMTQTVQQGCPLPTFAGLLNRQGSVDKLLAQHAEKKSFGEEQYIVSKRSLAPLLMAWGWAVLLVGALAGIMWRAVRANTLRLSTLLTVGVVLVIVALVLQALLNATQSTKSTPAKKSTARVVKPHGE
eukprot:jgi/Mesen1/6595/ME000338S05780